MMKILLAFFLLVVAHAKVISKGKSKVVRVCEGKQLKIDCKADEKIEVVKANYGRALADICPGSNALNTKCNNQKHSFKVVQSICSTKSSCTIKATNGVFGDPCVGTFKYLEVQYNCLLLVNGAWSDWSNYSACSASCDEGTKTRTRTCSKPVPRGAGKNCVGDSSETIKCNLVECKVNGNYSEWNSWGTCSKDCGTGVQTRQRKCDRPKPQYGGNTCELIGSNEEIRNCKVKECPINGGFGNWTGFSLCSKSCGDGIQTRSRECNQPAPANGGEDCKGVTVETNMCKIVDCPINGNYGKWNSWGNCSKDCGTGFKTRQRECNNPKPQYGGNSCESIGPNQISRECKIKECPINGGFGNWNSFSLCSKSCGDGIQFRFRKCNQPAPSYGGHDCDGDLVETNSCKIVDCPINGNYGEWNSWGNCSKDCGTGVQTRQRECNNPKPQYGGNSCESIGPNQNSRDCKIKECPINGGFGNWTDFSHCSKSCGDGIRTRSRKCNQPAPSYGGVDCDGDSVQTNPCKIVDCPINGKWSEWEPFSTCSQTCGSANRSKKRSCNNPKPEYGGQPCIGLDVITEDCSFIPCPVDGGYGQWSSYSGCSKQCGQGTQTRTRQCNLPSPAYGGKNCNQLGSSTEDKSCYTQCPTQYATACENENLNINCHGHGTIQIIAANYGRRTKDKCSRWWAMFTTTCGNEAHSRMLL